MGIGVNIVFDVIIFDVIIIECERSEFIKSKQWHLFEKNFNLCNSHICPHSACLQQ